MMIWPFYHHELQVLVNQLKAAEIIIPEPFQVGAIIAKLFSFWKNYRKKTSS